MEEHMKKKVTAISIVAIVSLFLVVLLITLRKNPSETKSPLGQEKTGEKDVLSDTSSKLQSYQDPSGFQFSFPEGIVIQPEKNLDQSTYAKLTLSSPNKEGTMQLNVASTQFSSADDWLKTNKDLVKTVKVTDIKIADIQGKQIETKDKIVTVFVDTQTLFEFTTESRKNLPYWKNANDIIVASFSFALPSDENVTNEQNLDTGSESDVTFEGEEIVE
ncbi:hypothetical protein A2866_05450 [Candidatus Roizmanbacteria bacterium RIFCSPHIGHO2_01_FULL_39_8]|uniref:Uncharacterized protein n=3 Tax=Candidatus Roizmaniibacteriota TaxID=1752723 RepID=A0A1F7GFU2_9BACT|nr:MAG: hypothetical protein A2866_05450 [Candidatus Roizmanbacteria bacterium RIFCSPHIGHO2_01_FULL_39_8]OGK26576.1 MAG: hypothetical protein A3C28_03655 [Candidatus Roizmanbacteria bacterium RIFCSPHIGHO2_02_FULL_39_9]OGK34679.1 MAG: hypothetical protein A3F60_03430 [Candidatus Roizmanbacteria bacterium RIFCSPHIGHO2_12_FULL_39_8]